MGQVPKKYLIIGNGRLGSHLHKYLTSTSHRVEIWQRKKSPSINEFIVNFVPDLILLCTPDSLLPNIFLEYPILAQFQCLHFSGAISHPKIPSAHPLCSFSSTFFKDSFYPQIPFILEKGRGHFADYFPSLTNPVFYIESEDKPLYHALAVLSGNATTLLWQLIVSPSQSIGIPSNALNTYLESITFNLKNNCASALTGPWVRGDQITIHQNQIALKKYPKLLELYNNLLGAYRKEVHHENP